MVAAATNPLAPSKLTHYPALCLPLPPVPHTQTDEAKGEEGQGGGFRQVAVTPIEKHLIQQRLTGLQGSFLRGESEIRTTREPVARRFQR